MFKKYKPLEATYYDVSFERWMTIIDQLCQLRYGLSYWDFPDLILYRDWYDSGATVEEFMNEFHDVHLQHDNLLE